MSGFHTVFKRVYICILFKHSEGFAQIFVHYLFFKLSMDKYLLAIYFSLGSINFCYFHTPVALFKADFLGSSTFQASATLVQSFLNFQIISTILV